MNQTPPPNHLDRLRGWGLVALYLSMATLALPLMIAAFRFWPTTEHAEMAVLGVALGGAATFTSSLRAAQRLGRPLRQGHHVPPVPLMPFVAMTLTLLAAGFLFGAI